MGQIVCLKFIRIRYEYLMSFCNLIERLIENWNEKKQTGKLKSAEQERGKNQKKKRMFVAERESTIDQLTPECVRSKHLL